MKFHFISSIIFSVLLALMPINDSLKVRMIYMLVILILFYVSLITFAYDYDKEKIKYNESKEKKLLEHNLKKPRKPKRKHK